MHRIIAAALLSAALATPAFSQEAQGDALDPFPPIEQSVGATINETDRMLVSVTIANAGPYPFIVDTAAERTVIARQLAEQLQLRQIGRSRMLSMTSSRDVMKVEVPDVSFIPGRSHDLQAFTLNGDHVGASGILGIDALRGQRVVLDFAANTLSVGPAPPRTQRAAADEIVVRGRRRLGQLVLVDLSIDGEEVDVIVDSGSQVSVGNDALRRLMALRRNAFTPITLFSVTGETFAADYARADKLVIGNAQLIGMPIAFANAHFFQRMRMTRKPALLLGMDALQMFERVSVDFPNRRAHFVLREESRTPPRAS
ncbi:MAG: aspartyl protease family protein [Hyphomonadaceae bacterium]|nr:aspartyl protease family protein [Hyphomonadaceae bacterium]